ncbi:MULTISPECIES: hypothetical protein [Fischerella]|nr:MULTISPECIES: hypothetical protein [Fischerella]
MPWHVWYNQQPTTNNQQPYPYLKPLRVYGFASPPTLTLSHFVST